MSTETVARQLAAEAAAFLSPDTSHWLDQELRAHEWLEATETVLSAASESSIPLSTDVLNGVEAEYLDGHLDTEDEERFREFVARIPVAA